MELIIGPAKFITFESDIHKKYYQVIWELELQCEDNLSDELRHEDIWIKNHVWVDGESLQNELRETYNRSNSILTDFCNNFSNSSPFKKQILTRAFNDGNYAFGENWFRPLEYYLKYSDIGATIFRDRPGFAMFPHIDNHHIMIQLILNLEDNCTSTRFYPFDSTEPCYVGPTKKYQGLMFLNTNGAIHDIVNVTEDRYIFYSSIKLTVD